MSKLFFLCVLSTFWSVSFSMPDMGMQSISFAANSNNKIIKKLIGLGLDCCDSKNIFDCKDIIKPDSEKDGMIYQTIWVQHSSQREILPLSVEGEGSEIKVNMLLDGEEGVKNITRKIKYKAGPLWVNSEGKESEIIEVGDRFQLSRSAAFSGEKICKIQKLIPDWKKAVDEKKESGPAVQPPKAVEPKIDVVR